jgi:hypothetical protein
MVKGLVRSSASLPAVGWYAELYICLLVATGAVDKLRALLLPLKRR